MKLFFRKPQKDKISKQRGRPCKHIVISPNLYDGLVTYAKIHKVYVRDLADEVIRLGIVQKLGLERVILEDYLKKSSEQDNGKKKLSG